MALKLTLYPYQLQFKFPFKIAHGLRSHTPAVFVKLEHEGFTSWGEATLPPYLPETQSSVITFLENFEPQVSSASMDDWFNKLHTGEKDNMAARAALDMALWDLKAKINNTTVAALLDIPPINFPQGTYTIGVCGLAEMKLKVEAATGFGFRLIKLKLDGEKDKEVIKHYKSLCNLPFMVDVNQGWKNVTEALQKTEWLKNEGCLLVEQPLSKNRNDEMPELKQRFPGMFFADESCQTIHDLEGLSDCFDGVNIKLMKCGGITGAIAMIYKAKKLGFKIIIGCMSESSVGCTAAAWLTPLADYADLDGNYLTVNDPFTGMKVEHGHISPYPVQLINPIV